MESRFDRVRMGERIRACRLSRKQTMKEFAELCGISERYLADIERGIKAPKLETFVGIVNAAGVSPGYLLQDSLIEAGEGELVRDALGVLPKDSGKYSRILYFGLLIV